MRRMLLPLMLAACLAVVGCGRSPSQKLLGKWRYDPIGAAGPSDEPSDGAGLAEQFMAGAVDAFSAMTTMEVEFKDDGTMSANWMLVTSDGTIHWKVVEVEADQVTLTLSGQDGRNAVDTTITFVDDDHLKFAPPGAAGKTLLFERVVSE